MSLYNKNIIIKQSSSLKYFVDILGLPEDLSNVLFNYFQQNMEDKTKEGYYLSKIKKNKEIVLEKKDKLIESPSYLEVLFPFESKEKPKEHPYKEQINYISSSNKKFIPWVTKLIDSGKVTEEDFVKIKNMLEQYNELVLSGKITGKEAEINNFGTDSDLFNYLRKYNVDNRSAEEILSSEEVKNGTEVLYSGTLFDLYIIMLKVFSYKALNSIAGKSTSWCVALSEGTFSDYSPSEYYLFIINGIPEILIHKNSNQIKASDDTTSINPMYAYAVNGLIEEYDLNSHQEDFDDYDKIINKYQSYQNANEDVVAKEIGEDLRNIIYVLPENYPKYMNVFLKNITKLSIYDIESLPKNLLDYIGKYMKLKKMNSHFSFMESVLSKFIFSSGYSYYFKKIPDIFHTKKTYEEGYIASIVETLSISGSPREQYEEIMEKLNEKERQRPDIIKAFIEGLTSIPDWMKRQGLNSETFKSYTDILYSLKTKNYYGLNDQIKKSILPNIIKELINKPSLYETLTDIEKNDPDFFEATKETIKKDPSIYKFVPNNIKYQFRFALLKGYINLSKLVQEGKEPYEKLLEAPDFIRRNPDFIKSIKDLKKNDVLTLKYLLEPLKKVDDIKTETRNRVTEYAINIIKDIPRELFLNPKAIDVIIDFLKFKGNQFQFLPKTLRQNPQILEAAYSYYLNHRHERSYSFSIGPELDKFVDQKQKDSEEYNGVNKELASQSVRLTKEQFENGLITMLKRDHFSFYYLREALERREDVLNDKEFLEKIFPNIKNQVINEIQKDNYISKSILQIYEFFENIYKGRIFDKEFFNAITNKINSFTTESNSDEKDGWMGFGDYVYDVDSFFDGMLRKSEDFIQKTYNTAKKYVINLLNESPTWIASTAKIKTINSLYNNRLLSEPDIYSLAKNIALKSLETKDLDTFGRLNYLFRFSEEPEFREKFIDIKNLYGWNWYKIKKVSSLI